MKNIQLLMFSRNAESYVKALRIFERVMEINALPGDRTIQLSVDLSLLMHRINLFQMNW